MDDLQLLIDLHRHAERQGPGGDAETLQAVELAGLKGAQPLKIADIGCGTGAAAILFFRVNWGAGLAICCLVYLSSL